MRFIWLLSFALFTCSSTSPISKQFSTRKLSSGGTLDASGYLYDPNDRSCDGFPRVQVGTAPGTCLGLVLPQSRAIGPGKPWIMPRTIAAIPNSPDFLAVDMGGWAANRGAIYWLMRASNGTYENSSVRPGLNLPHGLKLGPDGYFYVGETDKISRFRFTNGQITDWELVLANLPRFKGHMHPLVAFAFDPRNQDLYVNSGAPSDHCFAENHGTYSDCPEDQRMGLGAIYRVPGSKLKNIPSGGVKFYEVAGQGLRNSMAIEVHPSGILVQGENGRDFPQLEEPYEEMNFIELSDSGRGRHYGWPYCFNFHAVSPEWRFPENANDPLRRRFQKPVDCANLAANGPGEYQPPHILFPPHVAPLHMLYYGEGQLASLLGGKLLVSWHGYQPTGHRLVAYEVDERGLPKVSPAAGNEMYSFNRKNACPELRPYRAEGGVDRVAKVLEVISQWDEIKGVRPKGAPVGFTIASDGSIWIMEDKNRVVLRLAQSNSNSISTNCVQAQGTTRDPKIDLLAMRHFLETNPAAKAGYENMRDNIAKRYCASCHGGFQVNDIANDQYSQLDFLVKNDFIAPKNAAGSKMYQALSASGEVPPMPPGGSPALPEGSAGQTLIQGLRAWIEMLPNDNDRNIQQTTITDARRIRSQAGNAGIKCGQYSAGDRAYVDASPANQIERDGWLWAKTYLVPGDTRLFRDTCPYPVDGVYFFAIRKK